MTEFFAFIKSFPALVRLVQTLVDEWQRTQVNSINVTYEEREEERETIIWAMEEARKSRDFVKIRALNRNLARLDSGRVLQERPV